MMIPERRVALVNNGERQQMLYVCGWLKLEAHYFGLVWSTN